jgi:hypothetical protein
MDARSKLGVGVGALLALAIPVTNIAVASLWQAGVLDLGPGGAHGPNNPLVQTLFSTVGWEAVLGPVGILIGGWSAGIQGLQAWLRFLTVAAPILFVGWLFGGLFLSSVNRTML